MKMKRGGRGGGISREVDSSMQLKKAAFNSPGQNSRKKKNIQAASSPYGLMEQERITRKQNHQINLGPKDSCLSSMSSNVKKLVLPKIQTVSMCVLGDRVLLLTLVDSIRFRGPNILDIKDKINRQAAASSCQFTYFSKSTIYEAMIRNFFFIKYCLNFVL